MIQIGGFLRKTAAIIGIVALMSSSALAAEPEPPFFGPPGKHKNTGPGSVAMAGGSQQVYPKWEVPGAVLNIQSPWSACAPASDFNIDVLKLSADGKYDRFMSSGRTVTLDQFDADGCVVGGTYDGGVRWPDDRGTFTMEKSVPGQATYDQVRLKGSTGSGPVNVLLSLTEQNGNIGVANIASLGVIKPCCGADGSSQIQLPLGIGANGQPTVIFDIDGDGVADADFPTLASMSGYIGPDIPTLNQWGLIALTSILLIFGLGFLRKNRRLLSS